VPTSVSASTLRNNVFREPVVKCPKCFSGRISYKPPTIFDKFREVFAEPKVGDRPSQRYRCGACHFIFVAPDRRFLPRGDKGAEK
jgi:hypothetical protein